MASLNVGRSSLDIDRISLRDCMTRTWTFLKGSVCILPRSMKKLLWLRSSLGPGTPIHTHWSILTTEVAVKRAYASKWVTQCEDDARCLSFQDTKRRRFYWGMIGSRQKYHSYLTKGDWSILLVPGYKQKQCWMQSPYLNHQHRIMWCNLLGWPNRMIWYCCCS